MGVAKAALLEPQQPIQSEVDQKSPDHRRGISGMTAALALARRGYQVIWWRRRPELEGCFSSSVNWRPQMPAPKSS